MIAQEMKTVKKIRVGRKQLSSREKDVRKIAEALDAAAALVPVQHRAADGVQRKHGGDPVTAAEKAVDALLFKLLVQEGEGWLSEESQDDPQRLGKSRVWMVDPLDGTREYVSGIPEWCISIALVEDGVPVAGGVYNPARGERILGARETGLQASGRFAEIREFGRSGEINVLASRSEVNRGEWDRFSGAPFQVRALGSVAYKLALVAAGLADATWTEVPKHEWDVAAGVALVLAGRGLVRTIDGTPLEFNLQIPLLRGLAAVSGRGQARFRAQMKKPAGDSRWNGDVPNCLQDLLTAGN